MGEEELGEMQLLHTAGGRFVDGCRYGTQYIRQQCVSLSFCYSSSVINLKSFFIRSSAEALCSRLFYSIYISITAGTDVLLPLSPFSGAVCDM